MTLRLPSSTLVDNRYEVDEAIGEGGMGTVYRARDVWLKRSVALKVVSRPEELANSASMLRDEAAALASVRSDHVVQVYAFGPYQTSFYFAMEYVNGPTLERIIAEYSKRSTTVPVFRAVTLLRQVAGGLARVHAAGLVHRDVKPSNVVVEDDTGRPVLIDFGISAQAFATNLLGAGTPLYMAPEQCGLESGVSESTPQSDIYALGCTAFELFTGTVPFEGATPYETAQQHLKLAPTRMALFREELAPFDDLIAKCLAKDPKHRFQTMDGFIAALDAAIADYRPDERMTVDLSVVDEIEVEADELVLPPLAAATPPPLPAGVAAPAEPVVPPAPRGPIRVLVVDDDGAFRTFAGRAAQLGLFRLPVKINLASSGADALAHAERAMPDLLLLDFDMPKMNGIETLSRLRAMPDGARMRVFVISASAGATEEWQFSILGVRDFLQKPVPLAKLVEKIADVAARSGWTDGEKGRADQSSSM